MDTARYAELFLTESQDNLSAINHALLELERTPGAREPVGALFRAVHTVKGMSATMGYTVVAELSHELETLLDLVRRGERTVTPPLMDTLFAAVDTLEQAIELSVAGRGDELDVRGMTAALRAAAENESPMEAAAKLRRRATTGPTSISSARAATESSIARSSASAAANSASMTSPVTSRSPRRTWSRSVSISWETSATDA